MIAVKHENIKTESPLKGKRKRQSNLICDVVSALTMSYFFFI